MSFSENLQTMNKTLRATRHDHTGRCIYMVTLNKSSLTKDFDLCKSGRLIIISAGLDSNLNRNACLTMNFIAEAIHK